MTKPGYYVTLKVTIPTYKAISFFVFADNRKHAGIKIADFIEAEHFYEENPDCELTIISAGLQPTYRAEGVIPEFLREYSNV